MIQFQVGQSDCDDSGEMGAASSTKLINRGVESPGGDDRRKGGQENVTLRAVLDLRGG